MGRLTSFKKVLPRSPRCSLPWPRPLFSRRELKTALQILTWRHARAACTVSWLSLGLSVYYLVTRSARTCAETCRGRSCRGVSWVRFGFASCFCVFCSSVRPAPLPHRHPAHQRHPAHPPPPRAPRHSRRERGGGGSEKRLLGDEVLGDEYYTRTPPCARTREKSRTPRGDIFFFCTPASLTTRKGPSPAVPFVVPVRASLL